MRLRVSGQQTGNDYDLDLVMGGDVADSGLPHGGLMNDFVEAVCARDTDRTAQARTVIVETLGEAAMVDAAAMSPAELYLAASRAAHELVVCNLGPLVSIHDHGTT